MALRSVKSLIAVILMLGAGLAVAPTPAAPAPASARVMEVLDWQVIGTGTGSCPTSTTGIIVCTFSGNATGDKVGSSKYSVSVTATPSSTLIEDNGSGGECAIASGSGTVTAADMSVVGFNTVGLLCQEGAASSTAVHYNGTYRITPVNSSGAASSGRFAAAVGGGSLVGTLTIPSTGIGVSFVKIDGTINF